MAKKAAAKKDGGEEDKGKFKFDRSLFVPVSSIMNRNPVIIPVSPKLDIGLSGGIPEGVWVSISGKPKAGKTVTALTIAANAQRLYKKKVYYLDVEGRINPKTLSGIAGLDLSPEMFELLQSKEGKILSAEDFLNTADHLIKTEPGIILIIDSMSALCSASEMAGDVSGQLRSLGPKLMGSFCRKNANIVPIQRTTIIVMQHVIANTSGYGDPEMEDGGNKIKYQLDVKLKVKGFQKWLDTEKNQIGQSIDWSVEYSALGPPGAKVQSYLRYGIGIDKAWEIIDLACDLGLIATGGAWYTLTFQEDQKKICGQNAVWNYFNDNPDKYELLNSKIKEMMQL